MPGFEQNEGANLKLKSASLLEAERSEILNSQVVHNIWKHCSMSHFFRLLLTDVTQHFASYFRELGHKLKTEKCMSFQDREP